MKKFCTLTVILLVLSYCVQAQYTRYIVQLKDKKGTAYSLSDPTPYLSPRAIARRTRQQINIDSSDLPLSKAYLDSIRGVPNVSIVNISKWLNQVCIQTSDANALAKINAFPFVKKATGVAPRVAMTDDEPDATKEPGNNRVNQVQGITTMDYGSMYPQIHVHEGEYLHNLGFTGKGMVIAILDAGFNNYKFNPVFDSVRLQGRVLGEWDFVNNEASVNEDHAHGAQCFSIIAANRPGVLVGSAPHASFWLFRTENVVGEYPTEEQNWIAAAEFADSSGADMISSSLGYYDFDDPAFSHSYAQRDGNTAMITIAADLAAKKGIFVVNAAGNTGAAANDTKYVNCPADGDSVLAVGAISVSGNMASLSSWGPNGAGLLKPNVVSVGQGAIFTTNSGDPVAGSGTSYACPNMAGLVACLWQAFPEFTNMDIFNAVQQSAHKYSSPDFRYGYGIPNFRKAYENLQSLRDIRRKDSILKNNWMKAFPVPVPNNGFRLLVKAPGTGKATLHVMNVLGQVIDNRTVQVTAGQTYLVDYTDLPGLSRGVYYIRYQDGSHKQTLPILRQ